MHCVFAAGVPEKRLGCRALKSEPPLNYSIAVVMGLLGLASEEQCLEYKNL